MRIGIYPNEYKDKKYVHTRRIIKYLNSKYIQPSVCVKLGGNVSYNYYPYENMLQEIDYLIVLGGDGSLLSVSLDCAKLDIPVLLINLGTLGYLANVEKNETFTAIEKLINSDFEIDKRFLIESLYFEDDKKNVNMALNEIVITKGLKSKVVSLKIFVNDRLMGFIRGDGVIISTPTGSTAYNRTAGGSILSASSDTIIITPICPQTPSFPVVISSNDEVKIVVASRSGSDVTLVLDGEIATHVKNEEEIKIIKSEKCVKLIKVFDKNHFEVFQSKYFHDYR